MNRPSHWIIALFAIMGPALWVWGLTEGFGDSHDAAVAVPQRARLQAPVAANETAPAEAKLSGRVIDGRGMPVDGAAIRVLGGKSAAVTRSSGTFEVMVKVADPYRRIEVTAPGFVTVVERCAPADLDGFVVQLAPALPWQTDAATPFAAPAQLAGEGYVVDADRRPLAGAVVTALETGDSALTNDVGRFRIPLGAPSVSFAAWDAAGRAGALEAVKPSQSAGMVSLESLALADGAQVSGTVRLPDGAPAAAAAVVLRHHGLVRRALTDASGMFRVTGLIAADFELAVLPADGALGIKQPLRVEGSGRLQSELRLVAEKPHRVRAIDAARVPHAGAYVVATDGAERRALAQTDQAGCATLRGLAAEGVTIVEVRSADLAVLHIVSLAVEDETTVIVAAK